MTTYREILARSPIVGAPLAEVTDYPFRRIQRLFSNGLIHTEMVASLGLLHENEKTFRMVSTIPGEEPPVGIQIMGSDETTVGRTVRKISELQPTIIDINMACPVKKILKSNCGAWLLERSDRVTAIVKAAKAETDRPIGVKIRLGLAEVTVERTVDALIAGGVDAISIHGRTAAQMYTGRADRDAILAVARRSPVPVIASGDVFAVADVLELLRGGASGVLVARGMMGRPWFLAEARAAARNEPAPERPDVAGIVLLHLRHIVEFYGEDGIRKFRRHLVEYVRGLPGAPQLRHTLVTARSAAEIESIVRSLPIAA